MKEINKVAFYHEKGDRKATNTYMWYVGNKMANSEIRENISLNGFVLDAIYNVRKGKIALYTSHHDESTYRLNVEVMEAH